MSAPTTSATASPESAAAAEGGSPPGPSAPQAARWRTRWWWLFLCVGAVAIVAYQLTPVGIGQDIIYQLVGLAGAVAIVVGVHLHRPPRRRAWYLMAAGQFMWSIADAVFSWDATIMNYDRFPSPADPIYLAAYPVVATGIYLLIRGRWPTRDVAGLLDSAIVTTGLALLSWVLLAAPTIENYEDSWIEAAVAVAYPIGDIVLIGLVIRLITTPGGRTAALRLLIAAIGSLIVVDTMASAMDLLTFDSTTAINFLWLASYLLWGAAALHPSMYQLSRPTRVEEVGVSRKRLAALTLAVLIAPLTLAAQQLAGVRLDVWAVIVGSIVMFLLVVLRMKLAIDQIGAANRLRTEAQAALAHQAAHDSLTGLPNRARAMNLIKEALLRADRTGELIGLLFVDLDGFKAVNDTYGHRSGDELLWTVARRMESCTRSGDLLARLGGDEFLVLLQPLDEQISALAVADRLVAAVSAPITIHSGQQVTVGASVGAAFSRPGVTEPDVLLHEADVAVYRAKNTGRGRTEVFSVSLREEIASRAALETELRVAISSDQLVLHYQPIVHLVSGAVQGYEALVRWDRPGVGLLPPSDFIPLAEQSDLICDLDSWVFRRAAEQLSVWNAATASADLVMAVNMSARHLARPRITADFQAALAGVEIEPQQLILEITETALIDDPAALHHLHQLRELGALISIDDFGTGYSSIERLERLPVDILKIDRHFLDPNTRSAQTLLRLIVQTAHALGLSVIAEGVEDDAQLELLKAINCESAQGYFLGRPADQVIIDPRREKLGRPLVKIGA